VEPVALVIFVDGADPLLAPGPLLFARALQPRAGDGGGNPRPGVSPARRPAPPLRCRGPHHAGAIARAHSRARSPRPQDGGERGRGTGLLLLHECEAARSGGGVPRSAGVSVTGFGASTATSDMGCAAGFMAAGLRGRGGRLAGTARAAAAGLPLAITCGRRA